MKIISSPHNVNVIHILETSSAKRKKSKNRVSSAGANIGMNYKFISICDSLSIRPAGIGFFCRTACWGSIKINPRNFGCYGKTFTKQIPLL